MGLPSLSANSPLMLSFLLPMTTDEGMKSAWMVLAEVRVRCVEGRPIFAIIASPETADHCKKLWPSPGSAVTSGFVLEGAW